MFTQYCLCSFYLVLRLHNDKMTTTVKMFLQNLNKHQHRFLTVIILSLLGSLSLPVIQTIISTTVRNYHIRKLEQLVYFTIIYSSFATVYKIEVGLHYLTVIKW